MKSIPYMHFPGDFLWAPCNCCFNGQIHIPTCLEDMALDQMASDNTDFGTFSLRCFLMTLVFNFRNKVSGDISD